MDRDQGFLEQYKKYQRFLPDINSIAANAFRTVGDSSESFETLQDSLNNLEETLQIEFDSRTSDTVLTECADNIDNDGDGNIDFPEDTECRSTADDSELSQNNSNTLEESIVQIPSMIRELVAATQNPKYVDPREGFSQFSEVIQSMDMSPQRRAQFARILDTA